MTELEINLIGAVAALGTTVSWLPQAFKTIRSRHAGDFSWGYLALFTAGVSTWAVYGVLRHDLVVFLANAVTLGLLSPILVIKARGDGRGGNRDHGV